MDELAAITLAHVCIQVQMTSLPVQAEEQTNSISLRSRLEEVEKARNGHCVGLLVILTAWKKFKKTCQIMGVSQFLESSGLPICCGIRLKLPLREMALIPRVYNGALQLGQNSEKEEMR